MGLVISSFCMLWKLYLASLTAACIKCSALKYDWWTLRILFSGIACNYGDVDRSIFISFNPKLWDKVISNSMSLILEILLISLVFIFFSFLLEKKNFSFSDIPWICIVITYHFLSDSSSNLVFRIFSLKCRTWNFSAD